jgi:biotin carboxyl carrier protein
VRRAPAGAGQPLEAQMPGVVRRVLIAAGEQVSRGQVLILLEAMKMEIHVAAPYAGLVERVAVVEGQPVDRGQMLVALKGTA